MYGKCSSDIGLYCCFCSTEFAFVFAFKKGTDQTAQMYRLICTLPLMQWRKADFFGDAALLDNIKQTVFKHMWIQI